MSLLSPTYYAISSRMEKTPNLHMVFKLNYLSPSQTTLFISTLTSLTMFLYNNLDFFPLQCIVYFLLLTMTADSAPLTSCTIMFTVLSQFRPHHYSPGLLYAFQSYFRLSTWVIFIKYKSYHIIPLYTNYNWFSEPSE